MHDHYAVKELNRDQWNCRVDFEVEEQREFYKTTAHDCPYNGLGPNGNHGDNHYFYCAVAQQKQHEEEEDAKRNGFDIQAIWKARQAEVAPKKKVITGK